MAVADAQDQSERQTVEGVACAARSPFARLVASVYTDRPAGDDAREETRLQENGDVGVALEKGEQNGNIHRVTFGAHRYGGGAVTGSPPREVDARVERPHLPEGTGGRKAGRQPGMAPDAVPVVVFDAAGDYQPVGRRMEVAGVDAELPPVFAFRFPLSDRGVG